MAIARVGASVVVLFALLLTGATAAFAAEPVAERLGLPGPVQFNGMEYRLAWSSNPSPDLYKQEYLPAGQTVEHFQDMLMVDWRSNTGNAVQMVTAMGNMLKERKATDPLANYEIRLGPDGKEAIIDFVMAAEDAQGALIVEWTAQRYLTHPDGTGHTMVSIARRGYGEAAREFLLKLRNARRQDIDALSALNLPVTAPAP